jgi:hypothetical protein
MRQLLAPLRPPHLQLVVNGLAPGARLWIDDFFSGRCRD